MKYHLINNFESYTRLTLFVNGEVNRYCKLGESIRKKLLTRLSCFERKRLIEFEPKKGVDEFSKEISNNT